MIGREQEMQVLEQCYQTEGFQFLVINGRRRVGKTTILREFAKRHRCIFFSAQEKNDALNLRDFSEQIQSFFIGSFLSPFENWEKALDFISGQEKQNEKIVLLIDEFPFLTGQNPSIKSIFQHVIDHSWQYRNIFLVLCGSSVSFMVNEIMGYKSPLYGRITGQMEIVPFDYYEAAGFFPNWSRENQLLAYGILGGIPRYLQTFQESLSLEENLAAKILSPNAFLHDEPQMLLRMELREPGIYNSILEAIANGANTVSRIGDRIQESREKCSKYLQVLQTIRLVQRLVPCGEPAKSKKGIYVLTDFFYKFWYRFVFTRENYNLLLGQQAAAREVMTRLPDYMENVFETICQQYLVRQAKRGKLPFIPTQMGKWWGNNPILRQQDDVDILALDTSGTEGLFCECKYRSRPMPMEEYNDLVQAAAAFPKVTKRHFFFFSLSGYTESVIERAHKEGAVLLGITDLYQQTTSVVRSLF